MIFLLFFSVSSQCSYKTEFSQCAKGTRTAFLSSNCSGQTFSIIKDLDCQFSCPAGTFIDLDPSAKTLKCIQCEPGTFSIGGGLILDSWSSAKHKLKSYCWSLNTHWEFEKECTGWHPSQDEYLVSGRSTTNRWYETKLFLYPALVKQGSLQVTYRKITSVKIGEDPGEFMIFIDDNLRHLDYSIDKTNWVQINIPLTKGVHEIVFVFNSFLANGKNEVQIKEIQIRGTEFSSLFCSACAKGTSGKGADSCKVCGLGSYLDKGQCKMCPEGSSCLEGSSGIESCSVLSPCTNSDYHYTYTECFGGVRSKIFEWNVPLMCDYSNFELPQSITVECLTCSRGKIKQGHICQSCPTGQYLDISKNKCETCPPGKFAPRFKFFSVWDQLDDIFKTSCTTGNEFECDFSWEAKGSFISTSRFYQAGWSANLQMSVEVIYLNSYIYFKAQALRSVLHFFIDKNLMISVNSSQVSEYQFRLPIGSRQIRWTCEHFSSDNESCSIHEITLLANQNGDAISCLDCQEGFISSGSKDQCSPCPAGYTSDKNKTICVKCEGNSYSNKPGPCIPCVSPLVSDPSHSFCMIPEELEINDRRFFITKLLGKTGKSGYCDEPKMELSCFQSFFGPVEVKKNYFYVSVGTPSVPRLPSFGSVSEGLAYAFGVVRFDEVSLYEQEIIKTNDTCKADFTKIIVNLGSVIERVSLNKNQNGFSLVYSQGDQCTDKELYSTQVEFVCEYKELEGWPVLVSSSECKYSFVWPTVHACYLCKENEIVEQVGECKDSKRIIQTRGNGFCVFSDMTSSRVRIEPCKSGPFYTDIIITVSVFSLLVMGVIVCFMCHFMLETKIRYKRIDRQSITNVSIEDMSLRGAELVIHNLTKKKFASLFTQEE